MTVTIINNTQNMIKKALVLETMKGGAEISQLPSGFYSTVKLGLTEMTGIDLSETMRLLTTLVNKRVLKIQKFASFGEMTSDIESCLSDEEKKLYNMIHGTCNTFKENIMVNKYV